MERPYVPHIPALITLLVLGVALPTAYFMLVNKTSEEKKKGYSIAEHLIIPNPDHYRNAPGGYREFLRINPDLTAPDQTPTSQYNNGLRYFEQEKYEPAVRAYLTAIQSKPAHEKAFNNLGVVYAQSNPKLALQSFKKAIEINPQSLAWYNVGRLYEVCNKLDKAIHAYSANLKIYPHDAQAWNQLGMCYARKGETEKAIRAWIQILRIEPNDYQVWNNIGYAYAKIGQTESAIKAYQRCLKINPNYWRAKRNLELLQ